MGRHDAGAGRGMGLSGRCLGTAPCLGACTECYHLPPAQSRCPKRRRSCPKGTPTQGSRCVQDQRPLRRLGPLCVQESPSRHVLGHLWSQYSSPGPELCTLPVSAQTPVSKLVTLQFLIQPAQRPDRGPFWAWLRCFLVLAGVSSESTTTPANCILLGELLVLA